jgi:DNA helicase II / ATP-dependent DNA helicase PcrA
MTMDPTSARAADEAARDALRRLPIENILVVAPPGCGKTESLADRAVALVSTGQVTSPCRILALTFSNRARDNLRDRIRQKLGARRNMAYVTNLHGISSRLLRAHGTLVGLEGAWTWPQKGWRASLIQSVTSGDYQRRDRLERDLRFAKAGALDDDAVLSRLADLGSHDGTSFEAARIKDRRLDYQDLLRHAQRLLARPDVKSLYRQHFAAVLLDEAQDLTEQQLDIALAFGEGRLTAAADREQGIYSFAGADAAAVLDTLRATHPVELTLHRSYRSADSILRCVNALADHGPTLVSATPDRWADEGVVAIRRSRTLDDEADYLGRLADTLLTADAETTLGIISRSRFRRNSLVRHLELEKIPHYIWDRPTDNPRLGRILTGCLADLPAELDDRERLNELLHKAIAEIGADDPELQDELVEAGLALRDLLPELSLDQAVRRCNTTVDARPISPGVHLLTGHEGKGQQFDWVVAQGLEDGVLPDFRAKTTGELAEEKRLLRVVASRACYGLICTVVSGWPNRYGTWWEQHESRWLPEIERVTSHSASLALSAASSPWRARPEN